MRITFVPEATAAQRAAALAMINSRGIACTAEGDGLVLAGTLDPEDALALAAMPGVASVEASAHGAATVREAILTWVGSAAAVLGVLSILAANLPPTLGATADSLHPPSPLRPSWPLIAWSSAVDRAPSWVPVPLFFVLAAVLLFFWPDIARPLATKRPALHAILGVLALCLVAGLIALEAGR